MWLCNPLKALFWKEIRFPYDLFIMCLQNKKSFYPSYKGQKLSGFCDTTQIDTIFVPTHLYTIIYTPLITVREPVSIYSLPFLFINWANFKLPSQVHSTDSIFYNKNAYRISPSTALCKAFLCLLLLLIGFIISKIIFILFPILFYFFIFNLSFIFCFLSFISCFLSFISCFLSFYFLFLTSLSFSLFI